MVKKLIRHYNATLFLFFLFDENLKPLRLKGLIFSMLKKIKSQSFLKSQTYDRFFLSNLNLIILHIKVV